MRAAAERASIESNRTRFIGGNIKARASRGHCVRRDESERFARRWTRKLAKRGADKIEGDHLDSHGDARQVNAQQTDRRDANPKMDVRADNYRALRNLTVGFT